MKRLNLLPIHVPQQDHAGLDKAFNASTESRVAEQSRTAETAGLTARNVSLTCC